LLVGEQRLGVPDKSVKTQLDAITDLDRSDRMLLQAVTSASWQEVLDTHRVRVMEESDTYLMILD
jgi:hypothetical protein